MSSKNFVDGYNVVDLLIHLQEKYHIQKCVYFTSRFLDFKQEYSSLEQIGVEIVYKEKYIENGKLKANCDVEISHRITLDVEQEKVSNLFLISGDGDFYSLFNYAVSKNVKVKLFGVHKRTTFQIYRKGNKFNLTYISEFFDLNNLSKRKGPTDRSVRRLFDNSNISKP